MVKHKILKNPVNSLIKWEDSINITIPCREVCNISIIPP